MTDSQAAEKHKCVFLCTCQELRAALMFTRYKTKTQHKQHKQCSAAKKWRELHKSADGLRLDGPELFTWGSVGFL